MVFDLEQGEQYNDKAVAELQAECGALQNKLQQLKAKVASIADSVEDYATTGADAGTISCIVRDLRQLSANKRMDG